MYHWDLGCPATSNIDSHHGRSDENGAGPTSVSLACMDAVLGWWRGRIRTDQDVSKVRGMLKN